MSWTNSQQAKPHPSWWQTTPAILSGLAAILTAIATLVVGLRQAGFFDPDPDKSHEALPKWTPNELVPLYLLWNPRRKDHRLATPNELTAARQEGYEEVWGGIQGYALGRQEQGTIELELFYGEKRDDYISCSTASSIREARRGYRHVATQGFVFVAPTSETVPLQLYWHDGREDNALATSPRADEAWQKEHYVRASIEGYVLRPDYIPFVR